MHERQNIGHVTLGCKIRRAVWNVVRFFLFRPFGTKFFRLWRVALLRAFGAKIAWGAEVYASARIWAPWNLQMAPGSCIGPDTIVYNQALVSFGRNACLSQHAYICTAGHERGRVNNAQDGLVVAQVSLSDDAWVGARAFVAMGVTIGEGAIVGACACVFKDVDPFTLVGGNPAAPLD